MWDQKLLLYIYYKFLWIISEGLCDINLNGTDYLHSFVLNLVFFCFVCFVVVVFFFCFFFVVFFCE